MKNEITYSKLNGKWKKHASFTFLIAILIFSFCVQAKNETKLPSARKLHLPSNSTAFKVVEDDETSYRPEIKELCRTMVANLNSMPSWPPAYCERP